MISVGEGNKSGLGSFSQDMSAVKHFWIGWVEATYLAEAEPPDGDTRSGPLDKLNRVRVRIFGYNDMNDELDKLPIADVLMPNTVGNVYNIGSIFGLEVGAQVLGCWLDRNNQIPVVLGALNGYTRPPAGFQTRSPQNSGILDVPDEVEEVDSNVFNEESLDLPIGGGAGEQP